MSEPFCYYAYDQFADAGNDLIVEHIVEELPWADALRKLFASHHVLWIGIHAPLDELERREKNRGDRKPGEAAFHLKTHRYCHYDLEVDSSDPIERVAAEITKYRAENVGSA